MGEIRLSPSKLGVCKECPACFYDINRMNLKRPETPFPTLPNGIDRVVKRFIDQHRKAGTIPPDLDGKIPGASLYADQAQMKRWRHWQTGLSVTLNHRGTEIVLIGAIDDALSIQSLAMGESRMASLDTKTKGQKPKDSGEQYYGHQLDCYGLMFKENGYAPHDKGYLWYWWPEDVEGGASISLCSGEVIRFKTELFALDVDPGRAEKMCRDAADVLLGDTRPAASPSCEFCNYVARGAA